jgi:phospholipase/carboxylesterase
MQQMLNGPTYGPEALGKPRQLIILLHGLGADGHDLIGLAPHWSKLLPHAQFISPNAPFQCDRSPLGRQWFSTADDRLLDQGQSSMETAASILNAFIKAELERTNLNFDHISIVGFSQGAMMALHVALRFPKPVAAIVGYSGKLIAPDRIVEDIRVRPPTLLVHGDADTVVPFKSMAIATSALTAVGLPVKSISRPGLGHSIDTEGLLIGGEFLREHLVV